MEDLNRRGFLKAAAAGVAGAIVLPFAHLVAQGVPEAEGPTTWHTMDGRIVPIKEMTNEHLLNTINFLYGRTANVAEASGTRRVYPRILYNMLKEAESRQLLGMPRATVMRTNTTI